MLILTWTFLELAIANNITRKSCDFMITPQITTVQTIQDQQWVYIATGQLSP